MEAWQQRAGAFARAHGLNLDPGVRFLDFASEAGELSKELLKATAYGTQAPEKTAETAEELGDCLFSLLCLAEALEVDAGQALDTVLDKYERRFAQTGQTGSGQ